MTALIRGTTTRMGLVVKAAQLKGHYPVKVKVAASEMATLNLTRRRICPQWNYRLHPHLGSGMNLFLYNPLWQGEARSASDLFDDCKRPQAANFQAYLTQHRQRIVNYAHYQAEQYCAIGSGAVESAVKQIGRRLQIAGARWNPLVNPILSLRCAYLNGQLAS